MGVKGGKKRFSTHLLILLSKSVGFKEGGSCLPQNWQKGAEGVMDFVKARIVL